MVTMGGAVRTAEGVWLDKRALAALLGISTRSVDRLRDAGRLPAPVKLSERMLRWSRSAIVAWAESEAAAVAG